MWLKSAADITSRVEHLVTMTKWPKFLIIIRTQILFDKTVVVYAIDL